MDEFSTFVERILFWAFATGTAVLPLRWSVFAFIILSNIDVTTREFDSAADVGWENAAKTLLIPTVMVLRFCRHRITKPSGAPAVYLWLLFIVYSALAVIWSPFQLSGIKMVGYLSCYLLVAIVFFEAWESGALTVNLVAMSLWLCLLIGVLQTYVLDNRFGKSIAGVSDERFTSFSSPQSFAAFLLAILSILFVARSPSLWARVAHGIGGSVGLLLCGSRYVFLGSIPFLFIVWMSYVARSRSLRISSLRLIGGALGLLLVGGGLGVFFQHDSDNRIRELITVLARGDSPFETMGTLVWRRGIYEQAFQQLSYRSPSSLLLGSGTSSGASVAIGYDLRYNETSVDANRVMHNELIRVVYEWGLIGLIMFIAFLYSITLRCLRSALVLGVIPAYAFLSIIPTIALGCLSENLLAASALPAGVGFLLSLTYGVAYQELLLKWVERQRGTLSPLKNPANEVRQCEGF